jgi:hypothetical protein
MLRSAFVGELPEVICTVLEIPHSEVCIAQYHKQSFLLEEVLVHGVAVVLTKVGSSPDPAFGIKFVLSSGTMANLLFST